MAKELTLQKDTGTSLAARLMLGLRRSSSLHYGLQLAAALLLGLALGSVLILWVGENPLEVYANLIEQAYFTPLGLMIAVQRATPYILAAAAAGLAFQGGAINMGLDGQFAVGLSVAGLAGVLMPEWMPPWVRIPLIFTLCGLGGGAAALIPALFKRFSGVSEVITGMIANVLIPPLHSSIICAFPLLRAARGAASSGLPAESTLAHFADLPLGGIGEGTKANLGILAAVAVVLFLGYWMRRSKTGYEIRMTRFSFSLSEFAGIRANRMFFLTMILSGAIAGMAGATEVLGTWHKLSMGTLSSVGNRGIVLALVGGNSFLGGMAASLLYGGLEAGAMNVGWFTSVPRPLIDILVQMLFLFAAVPSMRRFFTGSGSGDAENLGGRFLTGRR